MIVPALISAVLSLGVAQPVMSTAAVSSQAAAQEAARVFDTELPARLADFHIPGAAVVVVAGGKQVFASGYGVSNTDTQAKVDPERTGFLINSVGKSVAATAAMQLVEQGKLDLNADVNTYLTTFKIPDTFPDKPITLYNLLTHTAGFEDKVYGTFTPKAEKLPSLADHLAEDIPTRVHPPGEYTVYSNYGFALVGRLVEIASGVSYADYVRQHVFAPLGMTHSTVAEPTPTQIDATLATGYRWDGDKQVVPPADYGPEPPAGDGNIATPTDMGRYLLGQLSPGILRQDTLERMHGAAFRNDPRLPGMGLGFSERYVNGQRLVTKGGDSQGYFADIELLPEQGVGIFVAFNGGSMSGDAAELGTELLQKFMDRFHPATPAPAHTSIGDGATFAGTYGETRLDFDSFTKVRALATAVDVTAEPDGSLTTNGLGSTTRHWIKTAPGLFTEQGGETQIAFRDIGDGKHLLFTGDDADVTLEQLSWYATSTVHGWVAAIALLLLLAAAFGWPIAAFVRRHKARHPRGARVAIVLAWAAGSAVLLFTAGFAVLLSDLSGFGVALTSGGSPVLTASLLLLDAGLVLAGGSVVCAGLAWRHRWWRPSGRIIYTVVTLAVVAFLAVASYYNLVGQPYIA
ncbi:serine hydrolase domain-containing protein [Actinocrispum wychmicini]|uniref:CubicO group peptidase (Beta-lactamase class C family) n=1 Tax=Actinocrispum wychmicini TaxID=1213861 RepID=A0A4R2J5B1_9PSEU|nr:serine hydrolase domain-containing protein [Actinocrispum wychmicini]TCO54031.1 CubicO group peptidase (beta-lactamase class C family) [Actinocrispum wychmicini]